MDITDKTGKKKMKPVAKKLKTKVCNKIDSTALLFSATTKESLKKNPKNPMLLSPVIRCVFKFLTLEDIKSCRLVSREWSSIGLGELANCARIRFQKHRKCIPCHRLPDDFHSCFLDTAANFRAFKVAGDVTKKPKRDSWTMEELNNLFDGEQKYMKELTLQLVFFDDTNIKNITISSWISKSPMVLKDVKHMTKLSIWDLEDRLDIPLHLIAHIKDLTLSRWRIHLKPGIKIFPIKLKLDNVDFYQDGIKLDIVRINDIVDFLKARKVSLHNWDYNTKCLLDLCGNVTLEKLILEGVEIMNGETSQWVIEHLNISSIPYSLHSQMKIKELYLSHVGSLDLFTLPSCIQKLALGRVGFAFGNSVRCSQPIFLENLRYLEIFDIMSQTVCSFLSHFKTCPELTHLKLDECPDMELKSLWMPENVKTLTLDDSSINWVGSTKWNLEKFFFHDWPTDDAKEFKKFCRTKIQVDDVVMICEYLKVNASLIEFLEYRNRLSFGKRLYIGKLKWDKDLLEDSVLNQRVDVKSSFYVFENGEKGRAISQKAFQELIPKHIIQTW